MTDTQQHIEAQPFEARQCPICKLWIFTAAGPFAEGDPTKTQADYYHWEAAHATAEQLNASPVAFPYFTFNKEPVTAMLREPLNRSIVLTMAKSRAGYDPLDTPCNPRRSAYSDGRLGDKMFEDALYRWGLFTGLMLRYREFLSETDLWVLGEDPPTVAIFDWSLDTPLDQAIGEAIGAGSMCWTPKPSSQLFDSQRAVRIVEEVMAFIRSKQLGIEQ